ERQFQTLLAAVVDIGEAQHVRHRLALRVEAAELALREHAQHLVRQDRLGLVGIDAALEVDELLVRTLRQARGQLVQRRAQGLGQFRQAVRDRKSTRLNSSHVKISYAVFCLKK